MTLITIISENDATYLKVDMGITYYVGIIDINLFPDELKKDYIQIINESIKFYKKDSTNQPNIISKLETSENLDTNNF